MICPSCGRELDDNVNFCYYCGHSFRENINSMEIADTAVKYDMERARMMKEEDEATPMKTWHWMLYFFLMLVPYLWIVWLIVTAVWAFGTNGTKERKNVAKGLLAAVLILVVIIFITLIVLIQNYGTDRAMEILTGGQMQNFSEYMKSGQ